MPADNPVSTLRTDKGTSVDKHRDEINAWANQVNAGLADAESAIVGLAGSAVSNGVIANGGTAGFLRTTANADYRVNGALYTKVLTDDIWDLSGETDTAAATYRAYALLLDAAGTGSFVSGDDAASATNAFETLEIGDDVSVIGIFIAGPTTDFDDAGGLAAQGDIYNGFPSAV